MKIALLGTGRMGTVLGHHVVRAGHSLTVWNRTRAAAEPLLAAGAAWAATPAEAVTGTDVAVSVLFGPEAVRDVVVDAELDFGDTVWLDVSTVAPADAAQFAVWARWRSVRYVHGPVIGSLGPARAGELGVLLGGEPDDIDVVHPLVQLWGDAAKITVFASPELAATAKLLANLALGTTTLALVDALRLGASQGLAAPEVFALLDGTALEFAARVKGPMIAAARFTDTQFSVDLLAKDTRLIEDTVDSTVPTVTALSIALAEQIRAGRGDEDFAALARVVPAPAALPNS
ncbi:NAD(P)-dependent oxidoreductase [Nocardia sp. NPDC060249]|uniref:NAD(P)-dependent oxidoreductase n=1 Tax=Nocardia sp. NPDC060249 TaxID=3347082 RepID=UPI003657DBC4